MNNKQNYLAGNFPQWNSFKEVTASINYDIFGDLRNGSLNRTDYIRLGKDGN